MTRDRSDAIVLRWEPKTGLPRRFVFEPQSDGSYRREEQEWNGCRWRIVGTELVDDVAVEPGAEVVQ